MKDLVVTDLWVRESFLFIVCQIRVTIDPKMHNEMKGSSLDNLAGQDTIMMKRYTSRKVEEDVFTETVEVEENQNIIMINLYNRYIRISKILDIITYIID